MEILSTYRLQFHKGFTFRDAAEVVPYLHQLGITHVYASPYLKAAAGSTHGYDVIDHNQLNPEIGSEADYRFFVNALAAHGMSHILDTVPNHMGIDTNENRWWNDVLAKGTRSEFANHFDIDWNQFPCREQLRDKVLLPVLGAPLAEVLAKDELQVQQHDGQWFIDYYDKRFPVDPQTDAKSDLPELLRQQNYRLAFWRVAADEINYRRFFDVTSLAAIQMQRREVFEAAHDFTFRLIAEGSVAGLRIDHPDGLQDPEQYFERLQTKYQNDCNRQAADGKPLYVAVEKILNGDEKLREDWNVAGTSGYDFVYKVNNLFVEAGNEQRMTRTYARFLGEQLDYTDLVYRNKCMILDTSLYSELTALTARLDALAQRSTSSQDFTRHQLRDALRAVIACFPIYRTYVTQQGAGEEDVSIVDQAVMEAGRRNPRIGASVLQFVRDSMLLKHRVPEDSRAAQLEFAQRFQQLTSPVNAKGIEDTSFYVYNRLTSLNEVGGDPGQFGSDPQQLHEYFQHKARCWPLAMSTLSTHDTKRSEDVRARLNVLSEIPDEWSERLDRWRELNKTIAADVHPNDQYLLYQTLLGAWPLAPMDDAGRKDFTDRICAYMQKALREAKQRTSWTRPDEHYEKAVAQLTIDLIDPKKSANFLDDFTSFYQSIAGSGLINSLCQTILRLTAPGIPDTYQGTDLWDFSLVDPDNRRPIDYQQRSALLRQIQDEHSPLPLLEKMEDGRIKLWVMRKLLHLRQKMPAMFLRGNYEPLTTRGSHCHRLFAFSRSHESQRLLVVVPRISRAVYQDGRFDAQRWDDTHLQLPASGYEDIFTGQRHEKTAGDTIPISHLFEKFPAAVLITEA